MSQRSTTGASLDGAAPRQSASAAYPPFHAISPTHALAGSIAPAFSRMAAAIQGEFIAVCHDGVPVTSSLLRGVPTLPAALLLLSRK